MALGCFEKKDKTENTLADFQMLQSYINSPATIFVSFVFSSFLLELLKHILYIFFVLKDHITYILKFFLLLFC